jgi:catechol 2,3-dioxygenase-like lactoylglutathione lyase family enzyme
MNLALRHVAIIVADVSVTVSFYERAFGLGLRYLHVSGGYAELDTGATLLSFLSEDFVRENALVGTLAPRLNRLELEPMGAQVVFVTQDLDAAWERALAAGAVAVKAAEPKPWGQTVAYLRDSDGALVELATPSPRG